MSSCFNDLIAWATIHWIAFGIIWILIGFACLLILEALPYVVGGEPSPLPWFFRITIPLMWPAYLVVAIVVIILLVIVSL